MPGWLRWLAGSVVLVFVSLVAPEFLPKERCIDCSRPWVAGAAGTNAFVVLVGLSAICALVGSIKLGLHVRRGGTGRRDVLGFVVAAVSIGVAGYGLFLAMLAFAMLYADFMSGLV